MDFSEEIERLSPLVEKLNKEKELRNKLNILQSDKVVKEQLSTQFLGLFGSQSAIEKIVIYSLLAIKQEKILANTVVYKEKMPRFLRQLISVERFYESIGGIVGYHWTILKKLSEKRSKSESPPVFFRAKGIDLSRPNQHRKMIYRGIEELDGLGEIYPIGGLGTRLDLKDSDGNSLPVAALPFCGRTLLEGLIRDVQAREFCNYRLSGKQITIPLAMMTSQENDNHVQIQTICEQQEWFGRNPASFCLFSQISVPVVSKEGEWQVNAPLELQLEPGGHGALWRTAEEKEVFSWFREQGKSAVLIRQINNPIGGIDINLFALPGIGKELNKAFGFASCPRIAHAAEGMLVLKQSGGKKCITNIEYTELKKYGIEDLADADGYSAFPANTNILYADLDKVLPIIQDKPLPGLVLNMKESGQGRLESMMQNISDTLLADFDQELPTFLTYNDRKKTISVTKQSYPSNKGLLETPEGAFYDLLFNGFELLKHYCNFKLPGFSTPEQYLSSGPSLIFLFHPAIGPLYDIIRQKLHGGKIAAGGELQLEIADVLIEHVDLKGSLLIEAEHVLGSRTGNIIRYNQKTGKCILKNVKVENEGIDRSAANCYWKNQISRNESLKIILEGHSELYAENITFKGEMTIRVPDGERWIFLESGECIKEKADWNWEYELHHGQIMCVSDSTFGMLV